MEEFYMVSIDKDLAGRHFFFTKNAKTKVKESPYGRACYTTTLGHAKVYSSKNKAYEAAKSLCVQLGFRKQILIHKWEPKMYDSTLILGSI